MVKDDCLFDLLILVFFLLLAVVSLEYNPTARSIPFGLAIVGAVMMFLQFLVDVLPRVRSKLRFVSQRGLIKIESPAQQRQAVLEGEVDKGVAQVLPQEKVEKAVSWTRVFRIVLWLVGFIILLKIISYLVAVGVFLFLLIKLEANESWARSVGIAVGTCFAFYVLFEVILQVHL